MSLHDIRHAIDELKSAAYIDDSGTRMRRVDEWIRSHIVEVSQQSTLDPDTLKRATSPQLEKLRSVHMEQAFHNIALHLLKDREQLVHTQHFITEGDFSREVTTWKIFLLVK